MLVDTIGCFFHFVKALVSKLKSLGYFKRIQKYTSWELVFFLSTLCFVSIDKIQHHYDQIKDLYYNIIYFIFIKIT